MTTTTADTPKRTGRGTGTPRGAYGITIKNMRAWRLHAGLTQYRIAKETGISQHRAHMIENGATTSMVVCERMAKACGITVEDLRFGSPPISA